MNIDFLTDLQKYIDMKYMVVFMAFAYATKGALTDFLNSVFRIAHPKSFPKVWVIFIIGTLTAVPYWFFFGHDKMLLFQTFAIGSMVHDMIFKQIDRYLKSRKDEKN